MRPSPLLDLFFMPGMALMRHLSFPAKMALMGLVLVLPLGWLTVNLLQSVRHDLVTTRTELLGSAVVGSATDVALQVQQHRGLLQRRLAGDAGADAGLASVRARLKADLSAVSRAVQAMPELIPLWRPLEAGLARLAAGEHPQDAAQSFALHTQQVASLRDFAVRAAESSALLLDPEAAPYQLMVLTVNQVLPWTEALNRLRELGGGTDTAMLDSMRVQHAMLADGIDGARRTVAALGRAGEAAPDGFNAAVDASEAFARRVQADLASGRLPADGAGYFDVGADAVTRVAATGRAANARLAALLTQREQRLAFQWRAGLTAAAVAFFGMVYLVTVFFRTSFGAVRVLRGSVSLLAAGDFSTRVRLRGNDELSVVGQTLDAMTGRLSEMVSDIRSNAAMVAQSGMKLSADTKALSERTEAQAASLEQTSASVRELTEAVDRSAQSARSMDELAGRVRGIAEAGGAAIQSSVASMQDIQTSSRRVEEIVGVIEGIAFQTNLLALNAAVEAARAGEQGRGFAVVAAEVRTLAQRSSASARQIKGLIGESVGFVEAGARQIDTASQTFQDIVNGVREVAENVRSISATASEQSAGLAQISQAVGHIDALTQQNAQMVDQAQHSSAQLSDRAERLQCAVASFRLRQGSADEALALVQRAVALYQRMGAGALGEITKDKDQWADRDMYVFAFDRQGRYRAFGGNPAKVGTSVRDVPGVDGDKLVRDAFERAAFGGGWVDYDFANPQTGGTDLKTSYVEPVTDDLVLGCGVYKTRSAPSAVAGTAFRRGPRDEHRKALSDRGVAPGGPLVLGAQVG